MNFLTREKIENWVSDFCSSDAVRRFAAPLAEYAAPLLTTFLAAACDVRSAEPEDLQEPDLKSALLDHVARLEVPASVRAQAPELCAAFLAQLENDGRLGDGALLAAYVRALGESFNEKSSGRAKPFERPGSRIGRNDPCPCGSGKKYKKCCQRDERDS